MGQLNNEVWVASGLRTPFAKVGKELSQYDAVELSIEVMNEMKKRHLNPDFLVWGTVVPNLEFSNLARESVLESELDKETVAFSTSMACSTSLVATIQAASMITDDQIAMTGGVESMSNVQLGLSKQTSQWMRSLASAKGLMGKLGMLGGLLKFRLFIPPGVTRSTGKSMGQHAEITAQRLGIKREDQDKLALRSHNNYYKAKERGFFDDLIFPAFGLENDTIPRNNSTLEKLATLKPVFDRKSGKGTLTAGNSTLFTDGAASAWVLGKNRLNDIETPYKARLLDWEAAGVNIEEEGILMAPTFAIPRLLERNKLKYDDIDLWEIHEAFAAQVLSTIQNLENPDHLKKTGTTMDFGKFPVNKLNPHGSSVAIGHPFGATGARILSQTLKEMYEMGPGQKAVISVCADGGLGAVLLLQN